MALKKKQKQTITMAVLGVAAIGLCIFQLGPIFFGKAKPKVSPGAAKAAADAAAAGKPAAARRPAAAGKSAAKGKETSAAIVNVTGEVNLAGINPRTFIIKWHEFRDPFSPADFEVEISPEEKAVRKLKLEGVIKSDQKKLAIISGRVYREGDSLMAGYKILKMTSASVILFDGVKEIRLTLSAGEPKTEK